MEQNQEHGSQNKELGNKVGGQGINTVFVDLIFAARHELSTMEDVETMGTRPCARVQTTETLTEFLRSLLSEDGLRDQSPNADNPSGLSNEGRSICT